MKWKSPARLQKVKKSMARLKTVVHERNVAHKAAIKAAKEQERAAELKLNKKKQ